MKTIGFRVWALYCRVYGVGDATGDVEMSFRTCKDILASTGNGTRCRASVMKKPRHDRRAIVVPYQAVTYKPLCEKSKPLCEKSCCLEKIDFARVG